MTSTKINRRSFVKGAAAGAAAVAATGTLAVGRRVGAADPVSLEFWSPANDPAGEPIMKGITDKFNSTIGKDQGIVANIRIKPVVGANYTQYTTAMTSSGSPDVVMTYEYTPVSGWAANGFIQPLDQYVAEAGIKESDFFPIAWTMINFAGHTWGLLQEFDFNQFWWNTELHPGTVPQTFDEIDALAKSLTKFDSSGKLVQAGLIPWIHSSGAITGDDWNTMWGGSWYDFDNLKWTIDDPKNQAHLNWMLKYVDMFGGRNKSDSFESAIPASYGDIFQYGKVAMSLEGEYLPVELKQEKLPLKYNITHPPTGPGVEWGTGLTHGGNLFLLPTKAAHPKEAVTLIKYLGSADAVMSWCVQESNVPPTKAAAFNPSFLKQLPEMKPWIETLQKYKMAPPIPSPQSGLFYSQVWPNLVDEVTYKKQTPQQALKAAQSKIEDAVSQFRSAHPDWKGE